MNFAICSTKGCLKGCQKSKVGSYDCHYEFLIKRRALYAMVHFEGSRGDTLQNDFRKMQKVYCEKVCKFKRLGKSGAWLQYYQDGGEIGLEGIDLSDSNGNSVTETVGKAIGSLKELDDAFRREDKSSEDSLKA